MKSEAEKEPAADIPVSDNGSDKTSKSPSLVDNEVRLSANEGQTESCETECRYTSPPTPRSFQDKSQVVASSEEPDHIDRERPAHVDCSDHDDSSEYWKQKCSLLETKIQELQHTLESVTDRDRCTVETERTPSQAHRVPSSTIDAPKTENKGCQTDPVAFLSPRSHPARKTKAAETIQVIRGLDLRRHLSFAPGGLSIAYIEITRKADGRRE